MVKNKRITLDYCSPESKYAEFDYNGIRFYIHPFDTQFAYSLDDPSLMIRIEEINFEEAFVRIKEMIQL